MGGGGMMNLELKDCWFLILMFITIVFITGLGLGEARDASNKNYSYSLGYAECKASMPHRYLNETKGK